MDFQHLNEILSTEPSYRQKQIKRAVFIDLIKDWQEASVLPLSLRERLNKQCPLGIEANVFFSKDKETIKALIGLSDGLEIETVLMRHGDGRNTVCVSSQVGCALGCLFCATGKMGFKRNLDLFEIVEQVLFFSRLLKKENEKVSNVVFMGMGEPFLNYENVMGAIRVLNDKDGFNLGARHISISTIGVLPGIKKLAEEKLQVNLAVSLHAPFDELRSKIVPFNKEQGIDQILKAVDAYIKKTNRRVMIEYVMIDGLNDSDKCAQALAGLLKPRALCFVNLISYNKTEDFKPSSSQRVKRFKQILEKQNIATTQRYRFGQEIDAGCGQLVAKSKGREN